jgi:PAS domain-containing protein
LATKLDCKCNRRLASRDSPEDRERCAQLFAGAVAAQGAFEAEYRLRRRDGTYRWVLDRGTPHYVEGILVGFVGFCFDATDRREADTARREIEEQVRLLTLATHDLVWSWDARSGRVIHNSAFSELLGVAPAPLQAALAGGAIACIRKIVIA